MNASKVDISMLRPRSIQRLIGIGRYLHIVQVQVSGKNVPNNEFAISRTKRGICCGRSTDEALNTANHGFDFGLHE